MATKKQTEAAESKPAKRTRSCGSVEKSCKADPKSQGNDSCI